MITIPTVAEIRDQILADIEASTGQSAPLLPRAVWRVLATALAGAMALLYRLAAWSYRQIFTATSDEESLVLRGAEYGLTRTPATRWIGRATGTGVTGTVVPAGTLFTNGGNVYEVTSATAVAGGAVTLPLESLERGDKVNLAVSETLTITTPLVGLDDTLTVSVVTQAGEDAENIEDFRDRVAFRQRNTPQGGAIADWVLWATEVPGIAEATVDRPSAGEVAIYPITDEPDPENRIPSGSKIAEVQAYVSDPVRSPIRAGSITTIAPTEIEFDVDIADLSPNDATTQANILSAIESYMYARRPKQYSDQPTDLSVISEAELTQIAVDAGAQVATVDLKNAGGSSIISYTLDEPELAVLRTLTWL